jgi:hypothetical protein
LSSTERETSLSSYGRARAALDHKRAPGHFLKTESFGYGARE